MKTEYATELLRMLWNMGVECRLSPTDGQKVEVRNNGEYDHASDRFRSAEAVVDGTVFRGDIVIRTAPQSHTENYENCILHISPGAPAPCILKQDGTPLTQVVAHIDPLADTAYETLRDGARNQGCRLNVARLADHERVAMFTRLTADRLARKCGEIKEIYAGNEHNWNETMYIMLMRNMGGLKNKKAFTELARRVSYKHISRERDSIMYVEAMLFGASGLLEMYGDDTYIRELKSSFEYLRSKYSIIPMSAGSWDISKSYPGSHPIIRIAQMAAFLCQKEFLFNNLMRCRTVEDVQTLFRAEASPYWSTHYVPSQSSQNTPKRIGHFTANIMGINLAVPMMFTFGDYMKDESLKEAAIELLEKINCESNSIIDSWRSGGVVMESAFDSQAMLQLNNEYCLKGLCWQCPVGKKVIGGLAKQ